MSPLDEAGSASEAAGFPRLGTFASRTLLKVLSLVVTMRVNEAHP